MKKIFVLILLLTILSLNTVLAENLTPQQIDSIENAQLNPQLNNTLPRDNYSTIIPDTNEIPDFNTSGLENMLPKIGNLTNNGTAQKTMYFSKTMIAIILLVIIVIFAAAVLFITRFIIRFLKKRREPSEKTVVVYDGLAPIVNYIKDASSKGFSKDEIKKVLIDQGWPAEKINRAFSLA